MGARTLRNPKTGETITFLKTAGDTQGELFQMSYRMSPHAAIADVHSHPNQEMKIKVISGTLTCTLDGVDRDIKAGETATIPAGVLHFQRNDTDDEVHAVEEYRPALQMQEFFEVLIGWGEELAGEIAAERAFVMRDLCSALSFWTVCRGKRCKRCEGDTEVCFPRHWPQVRGDTDLVIYAHMKTGAAGIERPEITAEVNRMLGLSRAPPPGSPLTSPGVAR